MKRSTYDKMLAKIKELEATALEWGRRREEQLLASYGSEAYARQIEDELRERAADELAHCRKHSLPPQPPEPEAEPDMARLMRANQRTRQATEELRS